LPQTERHCWSGKGCKKKTVGAFWEKTPLGDRLGGHNREGRVSGGPKEVAEKNWGNQTFNGRGGINERAEKPWGGGSRGERTPDEKKGKKFGKGNSAWRPILTVSSGRRKEFGPTSRAKPWGGGCPNTKAGSHGLKKKRRREIRQGPRACGWGANLLNNNWKRGECQQG